MKTACDTGGGPKKNHKRELKVTIDDEGVEGATSTSFSHPLMKQFRLSNGCCQVKPLFIKAKIALEELGA